MEVLNHKHVIGMLFYGSLHTEQPQDWLNRFLNQEFIIFSVILYSKLNTCILRVKARSEPYIPEERITEHHNNFFQRYQYDFARKADIIEACISTENKSIEEAVSQILQFNTSLKEKFYVK
jgi:hypothetical protein